ncbi:MerR family transcriptional regulator [Halobacillus litoralis]|uniref:MerR family transcriptional regulator n=1 Tax=Halobacillus litoralis TaxID=45668 RepID=A0A845DWM2_9BACI|nr:MULTISPECIES: MerR family transcriptional regulator [Halobacillus]MYL21796.1 MerR family transcriptional regulator [Halobacillus litoralis]MYL31832.1 MerR family transcriptional regulator [Halobacillus halophilus]MYL39519.1 MerR family transcriptional regulator [Halobacillus litoralis]
MYKVKEMADLTGTSIRTLHHYDDIGLLTPKWTNEKGYRFYGEDEVKRMQQILFFKEMDLPLTRIQQILENPDFNEAEALRQHKAVLLKKKERLEKLIMSVDQSLNSLQGGKVMTNEDRFRPFNKKEIEKHQQQYAKEVEGRWGHMDAYKESKRRTDQYKDEDWKKIQEESMEIDRSLSAGMKDGPDDPEVQRLVDEKRRHITTYFYPCTLEIFQGLGSMYVHDPRFKKNLDQWGEGYAVFLKEAIDIYCDRFSS